MPENERPPATTPSRRTRLPSRTVLAVAALPLIFGVVQVVQDSVFGLPSGGRLARHMIPGVLAYYLMLSVLTPLVHWTVSWTLKTGRDPLRTFGLQLLILPFFTILHLTLTMLVQRQVIPHEPDFGRHLARAVQMFSMESAMWYVVLTVSLHGLLYYVRSQESELAAARLAAKLAEARMSALGAQLRPHFLFNTLSTIGALAERGDTDEVVEVVHDLSDLLREVRQDGLGSTTTVAHEEALLGKYLRILHLRFGRRLSTRVEIEDAAWSAELPVLTLQVLVENAVKHGYSVRAGGLAIEVHVRRLARRLEIRVADSGPGFPTDGGRAGGGLSNLRARLQALYGSDCTFTTSRSPLGGAEVVISVPYRVATPPSAPDRHMEYA